MTPTASTSLLDQPPCDYVDGRPLPLDASGSRIRSVDPADPEVVVYQADPAVEHVDLAVQAARRALPEWSGRSLEQRIEVLRRWQALTAERVDEIADLICLEMGKVRGECLFEANALGGKVDITLGPESISRVTDYTVPVNDSRDGHCRFKPHGVLAVVGPFNFPAHLPNGHWVPALLTGNTIVFKPSDKTPATGQLLAELMLRALSEAGAPAGVFNLVQGDGPVASELSGHHGVDGVLFTGSWPVGRRILEANLETPGRIIALELGGSNPAVVMPDAHLRQAVIECVRAAFATTGQRCTCTRRIMVHRDVADEFIPAFCRTASTLLVGPGNAPDPVFMGPLVTEDSAREAIDFQQGLVESGGSILVQATRLDRPGHFVTPGVVQVDRFTVEQDRECFGPIAQLAIVDDLDQAIEQANATRYGLAASLFSADPATFDRFFAEVRSGCINWNTGTAGASSKLPFGGLGHSGNHRPAGAFSVDYCAYPVANMVERGSDAAVPAGMQVLMDAPGA
ncbi:MAG: aldehyde dehydrogenase family protein [Planctomycetota bacterium]|nr:aldehyde dehydrogenase family protein [Planctomycetota bacterium]